MEKYIFRCGKRVDKLISYFNKDGYRITACDDCADKHSLKTKEFVAVDYEIVKKENSILVNPTDAS